MWRKIIKKEIDKSKIKLRQQEVSRSVNQLETISQKLINNNAELLEELSKKEEQQIVIDKKTSEFIDLRDKAEKAYKVSKNKLDTLNGAIYTLEWDNKDKLDKIKELDKEFKERELNLSITYQKEEKELNNKIIKLKDSKLNLVLDNNNLTDNNIKLKESNKQLEKEINKSSNILKKQEELNKSLISNIDKLKDEYISAKFKKDIINWNILDLEDKTEELSKQHKVLTDNYNKLASDLSKAKKELEKTRETNLHLVKKEEALNTRVTYIKWVYEKAGIPLKI